MHVDSYVPAGNAVLSTWPRFPSLVRCVVWSIAGILMFNMFDMCACVEYIRCGRALSVISALWAQRISPDCQAETALGCCFNSTLWIPSFPTQDFLSWSIFISQSTSWHISRTLCSLNHRREANLRFLISKNAPSFKATISTKLLLPYVGRSMSAFSGWVLA